MSTNGDADGRPPAEDQEFEELAIAEEELIDAYVLNKLPADERSLVKKGLLSSPRLVERLHFARLLAKEVSSVPQPQTSVSVVEPEASDQLHGPAGEHVPWWKSFLGSSPRPAFQMVLAAGVILVFLGSFALLAGWMKLRSKSQRFDSGLAALEKQRQELEKQSAEQQSRSEQLSVELQKERQLREQNEKLIEALKRSQKQNDQSSSLGSIVASLVLFPGSTRDISGGNELIVSRGTSTVRLKLALEANDYSSYGVVIKNAEGVEVFQRNGLKSQSGKFVTLQIPAQILPAGPDYTARLSGITSSGAAEPVSDYAFRITLREK